MLPLLANIRLLGIVDKSFILAGMNIRLVPEAEILHLRQVLRMLS